MGSRDGVIQASKVLESASVTRAGRVIAARSKSVSFPPEREEMSKINVVEY